MILASCSVDKAIEKCDASLSVGNEKVFLDVEVVEENLNRALTLLLKSKSVKTVTIEGGYSGGKLGVEIPAGKAVFAVSDYPEVYDVGSLGIKALVQLDSNFCNMKELYDLTKKYPNTEIHFVGGKLLEIPGIHIGRFDEGKEKMSSYFDEVYDAFLEIPLDELKDVEVIRSKLSKKTLALLNGEDVDSEPKARKAKAVPKLREAFSSLFGEESVEF